MKIVLTLDLQEDNGTSKVKASETMLNFTGTSEQKAIARDFIVGDTLLQFLHILCLRAANKIPPFVGEPVAGIISNLKLL